MPNAVILNIDDNEPGRYARTRVLQRAGFEVHDAGTGREALRLIKEVQPDLALLDVNLPDMNGLEVCHRIKSQEETAAIIVLQISAISISPPQAATALNTGADSYLIEPVDPDVLIATINALLRLRRAERGLAQANQQLSEKNAELQRVNQNLQRSNYDLEHFAFLANHDLQEPLRNITTHLQLLERSTAQRFNEADRHLFETVLDGAQRMRLLIDDVLRYSSAGREESALKPTSLNLALRLALEDLSESIAASDGAVEAGPLPDVAGNHLRLRQVFQNLIGNSIKYRSARPPRVDIAAEEEPAGMWRIWVRDNGIGIAEQHFEKVFGPFKRLHGREIPGTGIGLALCRRIIDNHGGRIWIESREGEGTTVLFTLRASATA